MYNRCIIDVWVEKEGKSHAKTEEYDEATTRKLIAKVTIYDDYCRVQFKAGVEAEVKL